MFVFEAGVPQNNQEIFACHTQEDGLETVKNQGRQDIKEFCEKLANKVLYESIITDNEKTVSIALKKEDKVHE